MRGSENRSTIPGMNQDSGSGSLSAVPKNTARSSATYTPTTDDGMTILSREKKPRCVELATRLAADIIAIDALYEAVKNWAAQSTLRDGNRDRTSVIAYLAQQVPDFLFQ
ncbi:hypothetical protein Plhal304r1_c083g0167541 [Plasmopara halstedii]